MVFLEVAGHVLSAIATIILAFLPSPARFMAQSPDSEPNISEVTQIPGQNVAAPSFFEAFSGVIRAHLRADERYQQAAAVGALASPSPVSGASIEAALVNLFCTAQAEKTVRTVAGSGVFIDPRGVILTNAHIAQFLLPAEDASESGARCVVRQGNPAIAQYEVDLLYVSPFWIAKNARGLSTPKSVGTGERDFALLYVTRALWGNMPETFPSLVPSPTAHLFNDMEVRAAGYPTDMLTLENVRASLVPIVATSSISHLFTFGSGEVDLVAIAPSPVGGQGSSGGPITHENGMLIGLIATRGNTQEEGQKSLRALTLSYIDRTLREETGLDLAHTMLGDIALRANAFHQTIKPYLETLLSDTL